MLSQFIFPALYSICIFVLVILWLQSGFDKIFNFKDNLSWLQGHFSKSPFKGIVKSLLVIITFLELSAGLVALAAIADIWILHQWIAPFAACLLSMLTLSLLFMGQRIAKDYAGAATLVSYMIYTLAVLAFSYYLMAFAHPGNKTISFMEVLPTLLSV
jgi:ABC-type Na+ efflux pump permease subunit